MNILVLNGSPRPNGNTKTMVKAFAEDAVSSGHQVDVVDICRKKSMAVWPVNIAIQKEKAPVFK